MKRLQDRSVIVTGGAAGIGRACVLRLLDEGANVLAVDIAEESLDGLAQAATGRTGSLATFAIDVAGEQAPVRIMDAALKQWGQMNGLVNNAGIGGSHRAELTTDEEFDRFYRVNLRSVFRLSREALPHLRAQGGGAIVNVSSVIGLTGFPGSTAYSVAKAGVANLTMQMAADYGPEGIRVNAVAPGLIETDLVRDRLRDNAWYRAMMLDSTPIGRPGTPADVAAVVAFLLSSDADFVSGHTLPVDGGWLATRFRPGLTGR